MKKIFPVIILAFIAFYSCQQDPDIDKLDANFVVATDHDANFDFGAYSTFYIPDSVMIIGKDKDPQYWVEKKSEEIIGTIIGNMENRNYQYVADKEDAQLGIQVSYIENTDYFVSNPNNGNWWWSYPGYWSPGYWGGWNGWYYPYATVYQYNTGAMLIEMVDLRSTRADNKLPVRWSAYMSGLLYGENVNTQLIVNAINQSFVQSPYVSSNSNSNN